jgi:uncharacterized membrane-anchored protein YhcB (DUF1043 family)
MKAYLIIAGVILVLIAFVFLFGKLYFSTRKKKKELEKQKQGLEKNAEKLVKHAETIAEIESEKAEVNLNLRKATSEEIDKVLDDLINSNNNRVRDNTQNK